MKISVSEQYDEVTLVIDGDNYTCQGNVANFVRDRGITNIEDFKMTSDGVINFVAVATEQPSAPKAAPHKQPEGFETFKTALVALVSEVKVLKGAKWTPLVEDLKKGYAAAFVK